MGGSKTDTEKEGKYEGVLIMVKSCCSNLIKGSDGLLSAVLLVNADSAIFVGVTTSAEFQQFLTTRVSTASAHLGHHSCYFWFF